ncbi:MAG: hypothetical protein FWH37_06215 [Candidatus Bathyarchaeota archaeon]|nr:hypothetical protein [Candidatus Termiticorpusculum sp.]
MGVVKDWGLLCEFQLPKLDLMFKRFISEMYMLVVNGMLGLGLFDVSRLSVVISEYLECIGE